MDSLKWVFLKIIQIRVAVALMPLKPDLPFQKTAYPVADLLQWATRKILAVSSLLKNVLNTLRFGKQVAQKLPGIFPSSCSGLFDKVGDVTFGKGITNSIGAEFPHKFQQCPRARHHGVPLQPDYGGGVR